MSASLLQMLQTKSDHCNHDSSFIEETEDVQM